MRISIIIPMYNEKAFAERCAGLLAEMCSDEYEWEIIFSNDGSKDGCENIVKKLMESDSRLKLVDNPVNQGKGGAIRQGVAASTGDVVLYTDCDLAYGTEQIYGILKDHIHPLPLF